jgi:chaperonin GroEL
MGKVNDIIIKGVNNIANTVKQTLGTKGRTILFNDEENRVHVTKDGVTVARHIMATDQYENMVITVLREASLKTMKSSGDGTTTTMILAQYLTLEGLKLISEGSNYYELSKQMDKAVNDVIEFIKSKSINIESNPELLREIASISANDEKIGEFIYSLIKDIGLYGDIEVKESEHLETRVDKTKGMKIHKGWMENFMVNNTREMTFEATDCHVLIIDGLIQSVTDIDRYIKHLMGKPLVVFCNDVSDITLTQFQKLISSTGTPLCFVQNDGFGDRKSLIMNDLAALTSAYVIDPQDSFNPDNMGFAGNIKVGEFYTSVSGGDLDVELVNEIIEDIKILLEDDLDDDETKLTSVERRFHKKRLANLTGGVAVIHTGGRTKVEMKELKDRLDDAVLAVESAIKQGINFGGGSTYLNCQNSLYDRYKQNGRGYKLVLDSLDAPFKQLLINAELFPSFDFYKNEILKGKALDLRDGKIYDLDGSEYRVFDPTSVLIDSLVNATAVAKSLLSLKDIIYDGQKLEG